MAQYTAPTRIVPIFRPLDYPLTQVLTSTNDLVTLQSEIVTLQDEVDLLAGNIIKQGYLSTTYYTAINEPIDTNTPILLGNVTPINLTENWIVTVNIDITALGGSDSNIGKLYIWWNYSAVTYNQAWNNLSVCDYKDTIASSYNFTFFKTTTASSATVPCYVWYAFFDVQGGVTPVIGEVTTLYYPVGQTQYTNSCLVGFPDYRF
jgi:hypothetical protein